MNSILRIDLTTGNITRQPLDSALMQKHLGGMGIGSKILYDEVKPEIDPLGPDNLLIFASGPLNGTTAPAASRIDVTFLSPMTGMIGSCNSGGFWGPELKYAGYDILIVKGKASRLVYIWIDDEKVEIRDAGHLRGQDTYATTDIIKKELSASSPDRIRVAAIGLSGENLAHLASVTVDYHHSASKCGIGAVMGSKNLKAIALRGSKRVSVAQPEKFEQIVKECFQTTFGFERRGQGSTGANRDAHLYSGDLPGKNFQTGTVPHWEKLGVVAEKKVATKKRHGCFACDIPCSGMQVKTGKYAGLIAADLRSSSYRGWGATLCIDNLPALFKCHDTCEQVGLDYQGTQTTLSFAFELYQRGIINKKTTGGLELEWGNEDVILELLHKIARREGFGDVLADGAPAAVKRIGKGAEKYIMHFGGMNMGAHEPRLGVGQLMFDRAFFMGYLTSPRGGDNVKTTHFSACYFSQFYMRYQSADEEWDEGMDEWVTQFVELVDIPEDIKLRMYGSPPRMDQRGYEGKSSAMVFFEDLNTVYGSLGLCFLRRTGPTLLAKLLSACTGTEISANELLNTGHRNFALMWAYNGRAGKTLNHLRFPERFYTDPFPDGPAKGTVLSREAVNKTMAEWYELRDWDSETGLPTRRKLEELDLKDIADDLENLGMIKCNGQRAKKPAARTRPKRGAA